MTLTRSARSMRGACDVARSRGAIFAAGASPVGEIVLPGTNGLHCGLGGGPKQLGTSTYDVANAVAVDAEGQVVIAGDTQGMFAGQTSLGSDDAFITWVAP